MDPRELRGWCSQPYMDRGVALGMARYGGRRVWTDREGFSFPLTHETRDRPQLQRPGRPP